jgi:hypothetical protein
MHCGIPLPSVFQVFSKAIQPGSLLPWCTFGKLLCLKQAADCRARNTEVTSNRSFCKPTLMCRPNCLKQRLPLLPSLVAQLFMPVESGRGFPCDFFDQRHSLLVQLVSIIWHRSRQRNPL